MAATGEESITRQWARLWALRALECGLESDVVAAAGRIERMLGPQAKGRLSGPDRESYILCALEEAEGAIGPRHGVLFDNVAMVQEEFGLTQGQADLIALRALASLEMGLEDAIDVCGWGRRLTHNALIRLLAALLRVSETEAREMMDPDGTMVVNGILIPSYQLGSFRERVGLTVGMVDALLREHDSIESLLSFALQETGPGNLSRLDFDHLGPQLELAIAVVREGQRAKRPGIGILLHGLPGVGKTQMAKVIASECGLPLYAVESSLGECAGRERLSRLQFMQGICAGKRHALVLFDEAEDIWPRKAGSRGANGEATNKGGIVQLLETLKVPVIWATNEVWQIDPAFLRRFDMVLEVTPPPRRARMEILRAALPELDSPKGWAERMVGDPTVTPGVIARYSTALRDAGLASGSAGTQHFESMVGEWLRATGQDMPLRSHRGLDFDPALANATMDLGELARRVVEKGRGRVLMHGLPGTGKTEFAHYLARVGDIPVTVKRGSDIRSKYWGETERNLAAMFEEARRDRSVLVLDEADSFLRDRSSARYSWEKSEVNELLARMEDFDGIFLCSTNLMGEIDRAAMRRFQFKVEFRAMTLEQSCEMLRRLAGLEEGGTIPAEVRSAMAGLGNVTAGDFAAVEEGLSILGTATTPEAVLRGLQDEAAARLGGRCGIGFLQAG